MKFVEEFLGKFSSLKLKILCQATTHGGTNTWEIDGKPHEKFSANAN